MADGAVLGLVFPLLLCKASEGFQFWIPFLQIFMYRYHVLVES